MNPSPPNARSARSPEERAKIKRVIAECGLCGLANDTKWDEFVAAMREQVWKPSYRVKCVNGPVSVWDVEWFYHLPFPLISVEWMDVAFLQKEIRNALLAPVVTDHSAWIEALIKQFGLDSRTGKSMIRIFGYSPRSTEQFDELDQLSTHTRIQPLTPNQVTGLVFLSSIPQTSLLHSPSKKRSVPHPAADTNHLMID